VHTRLLFYDDRDRVWLVQDGVVRDGEFQYLPLGSAAADFRVFDLIVPRERRIYSFQKEQRRAIDEASLERQFVDARLMSTPRVSEDAEVRPDTPAP
jgi:hypothetical protein